MATTNNISIGANIVFAKASASFVDAGITSENTAIIYKIDGWPLSYAPGRIINGITSFQSGKRYYLIAKQDMDLSAYVMPPISEVTITEDMTTNDWYDFQGNEGTSVVFDGSNGKLDLRGRTILKLTMDNEELRPVAIDSITATNKYNFNSTTGTATFGFSPQPPNGQLSILYK